MIKDNFHILLFWLITADILDISNNIKNNFK